MAFWGIPGAGLADEETPLSLDASPAVAADARLVTENEHRLFEHPISKELPYAMVSSTDPALGSTRMVM
jgi:hypothetical protein